MVDARTVRQYDELFRKTKTLFSIHNLAYQGVFDPKEMWWLGYGASPIKDDFLLKDVASSLKAGLIASDALSTVSRRYAMQKKFMRRCRATAWIACYAYVAID